MPEEVARKKGEIPGLEFKRVMPYVTPISF